MNVSQHAEHKLHCFYIDFKGKNERKEIYVNLRLNQLI